MVERAGSPAIKVRLDRPAVEATKNVPSVNGVWTLDLALDEAQADGRRCIRCGGRAIPSDGGGMVPVGWADREDGACQIFAHVECGEA